MRAQWYAQSLSELMANPVLGSALVVNYSSLRPRPQRHLHPRPNRRAHSAAAQIARGLSVLMATVPAGVFSRELGPRLTPSVAGPSVSCIRHRVRVCISGWPLSALVQEAATGWTAQGGGRRIGRTVAHCGCSSPHGRASAVWRERS